MSNRFLGLEKELTVFDTKSSKKKNKSLLSKIKTQYSMQKVAPAVAAAIIGTGWKIIEFLAGNAGGDIEVQLIKMEGEKFPNDDKATYNKSIWQTKTHIVKGIIEKPLWPDTSATIEMRFKYNGHGVADVDMNLKETEDAPGFGLVVTTKMLPSRNNYRSKIGNQLMSMIEVTFNYRFTKAGFNDMFLTMRYELYGDGTVIKN